METGTFLLPEMVAVSLHKQAGFRGNGLPPCKLSVIMSTI